MMKTTTIQIEEEGQEQEANNGVKGGRTTNSTHPATTPTTEVHPLKTNTFFNKRGFRV